VPRIWHIKQNIPLKAGLRPPYIESERGRSVRFSYNPATFWSMQPNQKDVQMKKIAAATLLAAALPISAFADSPARDAYAGLRIHKNADLAVEM
jgi:hypothetical protein